MEVKLAVQYLRCDCGQHVADGRTDAAQPRGATIHCADVDAFKATSHRPG